MEKFKLEQVTRGGKGQPAVQAAGIGRRDVRTVAIQPVDVQRIGPGIDRSKAVEWTKMSLALPKIWLRASGDL